MINLQDAILTLQLHNTLVILRTCGSDYQNALVNDLTATYHKIDLAAPSVRMQVEQNPEAFARALPLPAYLQNLHYAPDLLKCLLESELPLGRIIADCTQNHYLRQVADSCVRQVQFMELPLQYSGKKEFFSAASYLTGCINNEASQDILPLIVGGGFGEQTATYIDCLLRREIMEQTTVKDEIKFYRFLCSAASMAGSVVNYAVLANNVGISAPTAKQWLQFLEGAGAVYFIQPIDIAIPGRRLVKAPKLYFKDTGVAACLLQITSAAALASSIHFKNIYENYVVSRIRESLLQQGRPFVAEFYRDSNNKEISLLLYDGNVLFPMIISAADIKAAKLQKLLGLLKPTCVKENINLGCAFLLALGGKDENLDVGLWRLNAGCL